MLEYGQKHRFSTAPNLAREIHEIDLALRKAMRECVLGARDWPLVLLGEIGSGKTCAALCLWDTYGGWYTTLSELHELICEVRQGLVDDGHGYMYIVRELWRQWERCHLTILDEFGLRRPTDAQYETAKVAWDKRWGKPAIVVSNLGIDVLGRVYDQRIASRMQEASVHTLSGDRRVKSQKENRQ